ncbi:hypothetical protein PC129_g16832 [Phytophthora cactorum]|uniref:Uncharacterized protein n=1 Tax=Phytophthora cactorum TaxID=29920 RepID=A0A8T1HJQ3_9STRA|nr:hypothetical protein Pcac1_g12937 [Phytophthora cactorum]KAG2807323.1 hypothetical protein PC111_g16974 [Phytophthora cactorum]KAG2885692.1 hypothetical protein PC114_g19578 [Phytophthora cactorum]KAG2911301.1 hypothetical protein PC117_g19206 [Phytophthora cactorum]KAG2967742.1 hypothetical protein PC118_g18408 [Phytophthora cactorum]
MASVANSVLKPAVTAQHIFQINAVTSFRNTNRKSCQTPDVLLEVPFFTEEETKTSETYKHQDYEDHEYHGGGVYSLVASATSIRGTPIYTMATMEVLSTLLSSTQGNSKSTETTYTTYAALMKCTTYTKYTSGNVELTSPSSNAEEQDRRDA